VSTTLTLLLLHNVESVYFFYSDSELGKKRVLLRGLLARSAPGLQTTRIIKESEKLPRRHGGIVQFEQVRGFLSNIARIVCLFLPLSTIIQSLTLLYHRFSSLKVLLLYVFLPPYFRLI
jgi:hypothetical protein